MRKIRNILEIIYIKLKGNLNIAKKKGMIVEDGVSVMGGVNFGSEPYLITLKKNCRISFDVSFITHDGGTWAFRNTMKEYEEIIKFGKIEVGEYSFIGAKSIIMPGVKIGKNSVIAAGSIVTSDVPDYTVVAGIPARKISTTEEYAKKCCILMKNNFKNFDSVEFYKNKKSYLIKNLK